MTKVFVSIVLLIAFSSCTTMQSSESRRIVESDRTEMSSKRCKTLGVVTGSSSLNGPLTQSTGKKNAKSEALDHAASLGATHIVWHDLDLDFWKIEATAEAYRCDDRTP